MNDYLEDRYTPFVDSRVSPNARKTDEVILMHVALGLVTEAGEFADVIKKAITKDLSASELDYVNLDEEIGDLLFYITEYCIYRGTSIAALADRNQMKLTKRYKEGFTVEETDNRDLDAERQALEGD